jgi:RHS repeat-associated protein
LLREENEQDNAGLQERAPTPTESVNLAPIYFYHPDHLGSSTFLTDANGIAYQFFINLSFGETMAQQLPDTYYRTPFKFNGKELDEETGLYYYGARFYDPKISIWLSVDPLAEAFPNWNPYNYCMQNPINMIDPDGRSASPIYGLDGKYLGNDSEGFSGEVLFMDEKIFRLLAPGGTDMNGDTNISHETAKQYSQSLSQVIGKNPQSTFTQQTLNMINDAITDVSNKTGYDTGKLHNGKVSSSYFVDDFGTNNDLALKSNDGSLDYSLASTGHSSPPIISFMIQQWHRIGLTVENIESTMFHEYGGHFKRNVPGDEFISTMIKHRDLINEQMNRPSFTNTTIEYQKNMLRVRNMYNAILSKNGVK